MNCTVNKYTIQKLLKKDIPQLEKKVDEADRLINKGLTGSNLYKVMAYKRALQIIIVSKIQNQDVDLREIQELIDDVARFDTQNIGRSK